jgi:PAS domain S-box-containing protein
MPIPAPTDSEKPRLFSLRRALGLALGLALLVIAGFAAHRYALSERDQALEAWRGRLTAMADDRAKALEAWLGERWGDAREVASFSSVSDLLEGRGDPIALRKHLDAVLGSFVENAAYSGAYVLDSEGRVVASAPESPPLPPECAEAARAMAASAPNRVLLYRGARTGELRMGFLARVVPAAAASPKAGCVLLAVDPARWLFPLLTREPVPTLTGETVLAAARKESIVFLSPLRFKAASPLSFRLPLSTPRLAARFAVEGRKVFGEFIDYRGVPVLAATRGIGGTNWGLVVKVDLSEALAPYHRDMIRQGLLLLAVLGALTGAGYGLWRRQRVRALKAVLAERERSETRILQLNRLLRTISEINQLIVREPERERLLAEACRILVESGMFRMAWVGFKDEAAGTVVPAASSEGARAYLEGVTVRWDDSPSGRGPTGTAIRENRHVLNLDVTTNPAMAPWRKAALRAGYRSSAAFPIRVRGAALGALTVYADRPHALGDEEVALLDELAVDLGYAIEVLEERAEHGRAQEELRESEERFALFMEHLPAMAFIKDAESRYLFLSRYLCKALGKEPEELLRKSSEDLYGEEAAAELRAHDAATLASGVLPSLCEQVPLHGELRLFEAVKFPIPTPDGPLLGGIAMDVTDRVRAEEALRELNASLERRVDERTAELRAANQELEAFSYSVSHDLRAPLRAIDGFSRALEEDYGERLDAEGRRLLGVIRSSTQQMGQLIDDLLDFSRAGRHELRRGRVEMTALARLAFEGLAGAQPRPGVTFRLAPLEDATGDPALLQQVWTNLLSNALKFSAGRDPAVIEVGGQREGAEVVYWVRDNGVGFDDRYAHKLFGVFQRLHGAAEFPGTGVGLAIVKRIVNRHGGRVWAESRLGEGAAFFFSLPSLEGREHERTPQ